MRGYKSAISFVCPKCNTAVSDIIDVPEPHWTADKASDMVGEDDSDIECPNCKEVFYAHLINTAGHCDVTLHEHPAVEVEAEYAFYDGPDDDEWYEDILANDPYQVFMSSYDECNLYLVEHGGDGHSLLNRMVFAQHIAALEAYLSDTLISQTVDRSDAMLALLENDKSLKERKFGLKEFVDDPEIVKKTVMRHLREIIYHDLPKVDFLYRHAFKIDLFVLMGKEDSAKIMQAIRYRHDCVHRNGKDKEGVKLDVFTKEYVTEIAKIAYKLVEAIEQKLFDSSSF